ncbi:hypothetical protein CYK25_008585 [Varibaculum cambriense]|nr:hypothetical protein CYK25_008585 [Varibaculum cambriense]
MNFDNDKFLWVEGSGIEPYIEAEVARDTIVRIFASGIPFTATLRLYVGSKKVSQVGQFEEEPAEFARCFPSKYWPGRPESDRAVQVFIEQQKSKLYPLVDINPDLSFRDLFTELRWYLEELHDFEPGNDIGIWSDEAGTYGQVRYGKHKWVLTKGHGVIVIEHYIVEETTPSTCLVGSFGPLPAVTAYDYSGDLVSASYMSCGRLHRKVGPAKVLFEDGRICGAVWLADPKLR